MEIYDLISEDKVSLAFINTCLSARVAEWAFNDTEVWPDPITVSPGQGLIDGQRARGMPFAWTHRTVADIDDQGFNITENMSNNGYGEPDLGSQCYIGFSNGSASLMQGIPYVYYGPQYSDWVGYFFWCSLYWNMTINDALDHASCYLWGIDFSSYPLQSFPAYWWPYDPANGRMEVYGNGRIRISNPFDNMLSISAQGCTTVPSVGDHYYDPSTQQVQVSAYGYQDYYIDYWLLDGDWYSNETTVTVQMDGNHELEAVFKVQYTVQIAAGTGGTTTPSPGNYMYDYGELATIVAQPSANYAFSHWNIYTPWGSTTWYEQTIETNVYSPFGVEAIFVEKHELEISVVQDVSYTCFGMAVATIDGTPGQYLIPANQTYDLAEGSHTFIITYPNENYDWAPAFWQKYVGGQWTIPDPQYMYWYTNEITIDLQSDAKYRLVMYDCS
jgi:hypothetical protein